jgi:hypothetical protein
MDDGKRRSFAQAQRSARSVEETGLRTALDFPKRIK